MGRYKINEITSFKDINFQANENIIYKDKVSNIYFIVKLNLCGEINLLELLDGIKEIYALFIITKPKKEYRWILFGKEELELKTRVSIERAVNNSDKYMLIKTLKSGEYLKCCFFGKDPYVKYKKKSVIEAVKEEEGCAEVHPAIQRCWAWDKDQNLKNFKLIIGTFPVQGVDFYYSSPTNRFWPIIIKTIYKKEMDNYLEKKEFLKKNNIILRDVIACCFRTNNSSDDGLVMTKSIACSEIKNLVAKKPRRIIFTGGDAKKVFKGMGIDTGNIISTLAPSPSRNNRINDKELVEGWRKCLAG